MFKKEKTPNLKKAVFICQISHSCLKVLKSFNEAAGQKDVLNFYSEELTANADENFITQRLSLALKNLGFNNNAIIISVGRNQATCRYAKIPAVSHKEIGKIVNLQSAKYLPYPSNELITGFDIIAQEKNGYSYVNQVIVHKDMIERYLRIFNFLKPEKFNIFLGSYGICNLFNRFKADETGPVALIDMDADWIEVAVIKNKKLIFSRSFRFLKGRLDWQDIFIAELDKTRDALLKETGEAFLKKVFLTGIKDQAQAAVGKVGDYLKIPAEILPLDAGMDELTVSFAGLVGLRGTNIAESLSLLPGHLKSEISKVSASKQRLRLVIIGLVGVVLLALAVAKDLDNRNNYLRGLENELLRVSKDAKILEDIDKRVKLLNSRMKKKATCLRFLDELNQIMPAGVTLSNFAYEEERQVVLTGQTGELNNVSLFVSKLETAPLFKEMSIKLRYATKKRIQNGEIVDFEIICQRLVSKVKQENKNAALVE